MSEQVRRGDRRGARRRRRERGCRFPGCSRTHLLQAHHVRHWAEGGPTDTDNLGLTFVKPNGQPHRHGPPEMREELQGRLGVSWGFAAVAPLPIH